MNKLLILLLCFILLSGSSNIKTNPIKGTWEMVYAMNTYNSQTVTFDDLSAFRQLKMYGDNHFLFVGEFEVGDSITHSYGGGGYEYANGVLKEHIQLFVNPMAKGTTATFEITFKGDTLIQTTPGKTSVNEMEGLIEKYIRANARKKPF